MLKFFEDPGHGWLEVPIAQVAALGITNKISAYSYRKGTMAYLEEDCDSATFIKAYLTRLNGGVLPENWANTWRETITVETKYSNHSTIRSYARFCYNRATPELGKAVTLYGKPYVITALDPIYIKSQDTGKTYALKTNQVDELISA